MIGTLIFLQSPASCPAKEKKTHIYNRRDREDLATCKIMMIWSAKLLKKTKNQGGSTFDVA